MTKSSLTQRLLIAVWCTLLATSLFGQTGAANIPENTAEEALFSRVLPVFDPGSHTLPISGMGFTKDGSKLVTVGEDYSIQVWSARTGERLDILRMPPYGREEGFNTKNWDVAAVSPDGRFVAIGGGMKRVLAGDTAAGVVKLLVVDVFERTVRRIPAPQGMVTALAFSPDARRLAVACSGRRTEMHLFSDVNDFSARTRRRRTVILSDPEAEKSSAVLAFSPDGSHLVSAMAHKLNLWKLSDGDPQLIKRIEGTGHTTAVSWSADGRRFARVWTAFLKNPHGLEIRNATGEIEVAIPFVDHPLVNIATHPWSVSFLSPQSVLMSAYSGRQPHGGSGPVAYRVDLQTKQFETVYGEPGAMVSAALGAVSSDGKYAALTVSMGLDAVIYQLRDGSVVSRCGAQSPVPATVAWAAVNRPAGFAWSEISSIRRNNPAATDLNGGFDLTAMEPVAEFVPGDYVMAQQTYRDWSAKSRRDADGRMEVTVKRADNVHSTLQASPNMSEFTFVPQGDAPPLLAWNSRALIRSSSVLTLSSVDGTSQVRLQPGSVCYSSFVASPDGRFLIAATGTHRLCVYTTSGARTPLLSMARVRGEWVAWSGEGYYTASPGGEKMIGWAVSNGPESLATFHTAEKFSRHFRRPDLLRRAIDTGALQSALKADEIRAPSIDQILPPQCELKLLRQTGARVEVRGSASPGAKDRPVIALRVLLNGRPLPAGVGYTQIPSGRPAEASWQIDLPAGHHELKLLVRSEDSSAVSAPLNLKGPKSVDQQPVLHRLCIGINEYRLSALNLSSATNDARDVYEALRQHCVGPDNRFGSAQGALLVNQQATRANVLQAIAAVRKGAKPGDLVIILFAGHGIRQRDEFYLLTHEANPSESLDGKSLSGQDLRQALVDIECPVLLMLDACHSASGVKSLRPATDDITRTLTDDAVGVTVLAAAMAHEVASATEENGHFTAALLKALQAGQGVPYDPFDHVLYTHHVYSVIFSEVRQATKGKQNPFLNMPWTAPPIGLRDVPH